MTRIADVERHIFHHDMISYGDSRCHPSGRHRKRANEAKDTKQNQSAINKRRNERQSKHKFMESAERCALRSRQSRWCFCIHERVDTSRCWSGTARQGRPTWNRSVIAPFPAPAMMLRHVLLISAVSVQHAAQSNRHKAKCMAA